MSFLGNSNISVKNNLKKEIFIEKKIVETRKIIKEIFSDRIRNLRSRYKGLNIKDSNIRTLIDSIVYLSLQYAERKGEYDLSKNFVIKELKRDDNLGKILQGILFDTITFKGSVSRISYLLGCQYLSKHKKGEGFEDLLERGNISKEIKLALSLYLEKGNFKWRRFGETDFSRFVYNKDKRLDCFSNINCWEGVLYAMYRAKYISKADLKKLYYGSEDKIERRLSKIFDYKNLERLKHDSSRNDVKKFVAEEAFLLLYDRPEQDGLGHDFVSVPYSSKQILKMLITKDFSEKPSSGKIFSIWKVWTNGILGEVSKSKISRESLIYSKEIKKLKISKVADRIKNLKSEL